MQESYPYLFPHFDSDLKMCNSMVLTVQLCLRVILSFIQGLSIRQIRFRFDGQPINETDTPSQVSEPVTFSLMDSLSVTVEAQKLSTILFDRVAVSFERECHRWVCRIWRFHEHHGPFPVCFETRCCRCSHASNGVESKMLLANIWGRRILFCFFFQPMQMKIDGSCVLVET